MRQEIETRLMQVVRGAVEAAVGAVTPSDPKKEEMRTGALAYFDRLSAGRFADMQRAAAKMVIPHIAEQDLAMIEQMAEADRMLHAVREDQPPQEPPEDEGGPWALFVNAYLEQRSELFTGPVQKTTRDQVMTALDEIVDPDALTIDGGIEEMASELEDELEGLTESRALTIARTEVVSGSNYATQAAAEKHSADTGVSMVKEWIATLDSRVRRPPESIYNHREPDEQTVPMDSFFVVSGEKMQFPGDVTMGASPGNTINCRCSMAPLFASDVDDDKITTNPETLL